MTTVQYALRLPQDDMDAVRSIAAKEGLSLNEVIASAVHEKVARRVELAALVSVAKDRHAGALARLADR